MNWGLWVLPGSSIHGISQARVLEWIAISFSKGSSRPRDQTQVSRIVGRCFTIWATRGPFGSLIFPPAENIRVIQSIGHSLNNMIALGKVGISNTPVKNSSRCLTIHWFSGVILSLNWGEGELWPLPSLNTEASPQGDYSQLTESSSVHSSVFYGLCKPTPW